MKLRTPRENGPQAVVAARCRRIRALLVAAAVGAATPAAAAAMSASVTAAPAGPSPVATMISFTAQALGGSDHLWYRFRVRPSGGRFRTVRDYGPASTLEWTSLDEGSYEVEASVQDRDTLAVAAAARTVRMVRRVEGSDPVVSPTRHPLVFLFSSPPCEAGQARALFVSEDGLVQTTPSTPCDSARSVNFYLAGLSPDTSYTARLLVEGGDPSSAIGPVVSFQTGDVPPDKTAVALASVLRAATDPGFDGILLQVPLYSPPIATDLTGRLVWFGPDDVTLLTRPGSDATYYGIVQPSNDPEQIAVRRFDLVGLTVAETNVARVNEQLAALGRRTVTAFHHEARPLPGGKMLLLGTVQEVLNDVQGPGPVNVLGDMVLVLDANLQVVWTWDAFDHLDTSRRAILGERCRTSPGCPPHDLSADANDWTHANSVGRTPDGNLLLSLRHQDWLIKIDYRDGAGSGDVLWRLGKDGDFTFTSTDPYPWFSHQHDADYETGSASTIDLFDNGNTRTVVLPDQLSRGQAIQVDEKNRTARLVVNVGLGLLSGALGAAQRLPDGTYHFEAGIVSDAESTKDTSSFAMQVDRHGNLLSSIKLSWPVYRSFRIRDLYNSSAVQQPATGSGTVTLQ